MILSMVNTGGLVSKTRTVKPASRQCSRFQISVSKSSNRSLGFGEFDVESDIRISNRSRPPLHLCLANLPECPLARLLSYNWKNLFKGVAEVPVLFKKKIRPIFLFSFNVQSLSFFNLLVYALSLNPGTVRAKRCRTLSRCLYQSFS